MIKHSGIKIKEEQIRYTENKEDPMYVKLLDMKRPKEVNAEKN